MKQQECTRFQSGVARMGLEGDEKMLRRKRIVVTVLIGMLLVGVIGIGMVSTTIASEETTATQPVHFSKLIEFLPAAPFGWKGGEPSGTMAGFGEPPYSSASKNYSKMFSEEITAVVMIADSSPALEWFEEWQEGYAKESKEGYVKGITFKGFPTWEGYVAESNSYYVYSNINDRFIVAISTNSDIKTLYNFANAIDYNGIAAFAESVVPPARTAHPTEQPTQPSAKETPTTPAEEEKTPGFEVLFAIAGLMAVAYLLRRNRSRK